MRRKLLDNTEISLDNNNHYSRSNRNDSEFNHEKITVSLIDKMRMLFWSIFISCISVGVPIFTGLSNTIQSQNLMAAFSLSHNVLPYSMIQVNGGFLYYVILAIAYHFGSLLWVIPFFTLTLYLSSIYLYKIVYFFTKHYSFATVICLLFYLFNLCIGFGGFYPVQFGMPFFLIGLFYLLRYFYLSSSDEIFITYGFMMTLALFFEPSFLIFDLIAFVILIGFNLYHKRIGRGIYQFLCLVFGVLAIGYIVGYFLFNMQLLSTYVQQTIFETLLGYSFGNASLWQTALFQFVVLLISGVVLATFYGIKNLFNTQFQSANLLLVVSLIIYAFRICLVRDYQVYHVLEIFPITVILLAINRSQETIDMTGDNLFFEFFSKHLYLPVILLLFGLLQPVMDYFMTSSYHNDRVVLSTYLKRYLNSKDNIYVWDNRADLYIMTNSHASTKFSIPVIFVSKDNKKLLEDNLLAQENKYIVVNDSVPVASAVKKLLDKNYKLVSVRGVSHFKLYLLK